MNIGLRIKELRTKKKLTIKSVSNDLKIDSSQFSKIEKGNLNPTLPQLMELSSFFNVSLDFLCKGELATSNKKNLIPFYEEVNTIGGASRVADTETSYATPSATIDSGDWFKGATAAIRHYGHSMDEYQSGCILAIRELRNRDEIIWGRNYVVETDEIRVTKKLADLNENYIVGYSTNSATYPDGVLIHQPMKILKENIRKISIVLGAVTKDESSGQVQLI